MHRPVLIFIHLLLLFGALTPFSYGFGQQVVTGDSLNTPETDTLATLPDSLGGDSLVTLSDSTSKDSLKSPRTVLLDSLRAQSDLQSQVEYHATDSIVFDIENRKLFIHSRGKGQKEGPNLKYEDIALSADSIMIDWEATTLFAEGKMDSTGQITGQPEFTEKDQNYSAKKIAYNFKTQKGKISLARTNLDGDIILGESIKKDKDNVYRIKNGQFTTCDADTPHYHIRSSKLKILPGDRIISGPLMLVIEKFPIPIVVPFGFFPNNATRKSGVILPEYGEAADRGFFLRGGGYFWAINDSFDLEVRGDIFSKGGFRVEVGTHYNVRYKYSGNITWQTGYQKFGEKWGDAEYEQDAGYSANLSHKLTWNHDQRINPTATLKAKVDIGSTDFNRANSYNTEEYLTATLNSSVAYNQSFPNSPYRLSATLTHDQNTQTGKVNLGLPSITFSKKYDTPFKRKKGIAKDAWYEKIGYSYTMNAKNRVSATDSLLLPIVQGLFDGSDVLVVNTSTEGDSTVLDTTMISPLDYFNNGIQHSIPINANFQVAKYITVTPSINYVEYWYFRTIEKIYDYAQNRTLTNNRDGFAATRSFNGNLTANTRLFFISQIKNSKRGTAFRYQLNPSLGYSYKPDFSDDFWGIYEDVALDTAVTPTRYSRFEGALFGGPSAGEQQSINFGITNILEMKYKSLKEDTATVVDPKADPFTRVRLLDNLRVSSSYNFAADSLKLAPFSMSARTTLFQKKVNIQASANLDPYVFDTESGRRIDQLVWDKRKGLGRITRATLAVNTSFRSKKKSGEKRTDRLDEGKYADVLAYRDAYVDFTVPWTLNLGYNLSYSDNGTRKDTVQALTFSGDFNLTPKWKVVFNSGFDFTARDFSFTRFAITRDMHCWEMSLNWVPFGDRQSYTFSLNVKNPTLKDLKLTKRSDWQDRR